MNCVEGRSESIEEIQIEVYGSKKSGPRKFSWSKLSWKASEQEDCAVCLESFKIRDILIPLPCAHKFHSVCLKPWLENNSHCPCCRTTIPFLQICNFSQLSKFNRRLGFDELGFFFYLELCFLDLVLMDYLRRFMRLNFFKIFLLFTFFHMLGFSHISIFKLKNIQNDYLCEN